MNSSLSPPDALPTPPLALPSPPPSSSPPAPPPPMDSQPTNSTDSPSDDPSVSDSPPDDPPDSSTDPSANDSSPPDSSNDPPDDAPAPPPPDPQDTSPSPPSTSSRNQTPPTPSQEPPQNSPPPPVSSTSKNSPPAPPVEDSPPSVASNDSSPSGSPPTPLSSASQSSSISPPPPLSSGSPPPPLTSISTTPSISSTAPPPPLSSGSPPPPGTSLTTSLVTGNPPISLTPPPLGTSLVPPGEPVASFSNNESGKSESNGGGIGTTGVIAIGIVAGYLLLGVIGLAVWWFCRNKKKLTPEVGSVMPTSSNSPQSDYSLRKMRSSPVSNASGSVQESKNWYSYEELASATAEFSERNILGEGGFGPVFKGCLPDGREVAVKQLKDGGGQGEREFRAEVETISRIHHRHLVSVVGYCISYDKRLLVYDYVPNNTLHFHLHGKAENALDWPTRIKIATGAARGIAYLHEDCHPRIVHRDIKSSNILLNNSFEAQVSDFGLARIFSDLHTHVTTRVMGTFGYMAPEYASSGILTEKSDVFSFGVVLLELITGRKPVDSSQPLGEESLVEWARPLLNDALEKEEFEKLVDPRLGKDYVSREMFRMIEAAAACVRYSALRRPKMSRVLRAFEDMSLSDLTHGMKVDESEIIDSAQQSAEFRLFRRMAFGSQDYSSSDFSMLSDMQTEEK